MAMPPVGKKENAMNPAESAVPRSDETEKPTRAENLARLAALEERAARQRQEFRDLTADIDQLEADAGELDETLRQLRGRVDSARERYNARRAAVDKPSRGPWPWGLPIALCIMAVGNILLITSRFIPANLHAKGTSFALVMIAYFITGLTLIRLKSEKRLCGSAARIDILDRRSRLQ
jgi:uncharacterized coiled-coil protein SlyX